MQCDECGKNPAVMRFVTNIDGKVSERHLCAQCMAKIARQNRLNPQALIASLIGMNSDKAKNLRCPECGLTYADFLQKGQCLQCASCYDAFREPLTAWLTERNGSARHVGSVPDSADDQTRLRYRLDALQRDLSEAVQQEAFERAALLRDEINALTPAGKDEASNG